MYSYYISYLVIMSCCFCQISQKIYLGIGAIVGVTVSGSNIFNSHVIISNIAKIHPIEFTDPLYYCSISLIKGVCYGAIWPAFGSWLLYKRHMLTPHLVELKYTNFRIVVDINSPKYQSYPNAYDARRELGPY